MPVSLIYVLMDADRGFVALEPCSCCSTKPWLDLAQESQLLLSGDHSPTDLDNDVEF